MESFLESVAELLDTDKVLTADMTLEEIGEWDSLSIVSFLAMVDVDYGKHMKIVEFKDAKTFGDLYELVINK